MNSNSMRHQDMIPFVAGNGGMTGQMISRNAWQHEANAAISNLRLLQDAGVTPNRTRGFGYKLVATRRFSAAVGDALVRLGGRLQSGATLPATAPAAPAADPGQGDRLPGAVRTNRRFRMYMHTSPPVRLHSAA
jgi:hypothetical protein